MTTSGIFIPSVVCWNGGTYDGIKCLCTPYFYGPFCEYSTDSIETNLPYPGTIVAEVGLVVTVTNFNYTENLKDTQSETYRSFEEHFQREIKKIYGHIPGYEGVRIISLKPGSIVVNHEIVFTMMESGNTTANFEEITKRLVGRLQETEASQGSCQHNSSILCLTVPPNPVVKNMTQASSLDEICWQRAPREYQDFYYPVTVSGTIHCITNCTPNMPSTIDCHYGQCHVTQAGPQCFCQDEALYWYTGDHCSKRISKVATGLGLVATLLLIVCIVLAVMLLRHYRRKHVLSDPQADTDGNWYEDEGFTWRSPDGFTYCNIGADSTAGDPLNAGSGRWRPMLGEDPRDVQPPSRHLPTGGESPRNFKPSLELVDTSIPLKISRPKVTTRL